MSLENLPLPELDEEFKDLYYDYYHLHKKKQQELKLLINFVKSHKLSKKHISHTAIDVPKEILKLLKSYNKLVDKFDILTLKMSIKMVDIPFDGALEQEMMKAISDALDHREKEAKVREKINNYFVDATK